MGGGVNSSAPLPPLLRAALLPLLLQKFAFIVMLPAVLGFFFVLLHVGSVAHKACILGRRKNLQRNLAGLISSFLLLFYVLYLYLTTTMLGIFNCVPTNPPDGQLYLTVRMGGGGGGTRPTASCTSR